MKKKLLSFFMSLAIAITTIFPSSVLSALALDTANVDLTLNVPKDTVLSGNSAVFELDLKVAGSQESINEEIGNYSVLTVNLPNDLKDYYELDESNLAIDNIVPVYDRDNSTLTYKFPELKTGLSVRKFIKLKTKNGITPNGTELNVSAILSKSDGSSMASTENKKIIVQSSLKPSISKKFEKIVQDETAYAARPGNEVVYKVTASIPAPVNSNPGSLYLKGGSDIVISDTLDSRLTYVNSSFSNSSATTSVDGQTVNWTFKAPSVADQARNNEYIFETEFYITVKVSEQISSDTFIENAVNITATALDGTKLENLASNKVKVNVLLPGNPIGDGANMPVRKTYGPGYTSVDYNPNKGQTEDQAVSFLDVYTAGADATDYIINDTTKEPYKWNANTVVNDGYKKIVATYTPSDNLIFRSLYLLLPFSFKTPITNPVQYLQLNKIPRTIVEFTLDDNTKKTYEYDWTNISKEVIPQPTGQDLAYNALGLGKDDKVKSFTITYENADGSLIDGRFAEQVASRYDVVPGTADKTENNGNRVELKTEYLVTLADGTQVYRGPNPENIYGTDVAVRYTTIVNEKKEPPKVEQRVDLLTKDGNVITDGDNRVQLQIRNNNSSLTSITDDTTKIESVVILPLGVKLNSDPLAKYYVRSQRAYTFTENIPDGKISVLSDNYNGTGHQAVKVTWDRRTLLPGETVVAEFGVTIDKKAPDSLTFDAYGFGTTFTDKMTEVVTASPITVETTDINGDGITGKDIVTRTNTFVKLTQHDLKIEKFVKGSFDSEYSKFAYTKPGGDIDYKITMTNTTGENIYKLGFLDVLPSVGDLGIVDNVSRGSAFAPALKGAITLPSEWQDKVTVYYSTEANPKRSDVLYNKVTYPTGAYVHQDPADAVDANWMVESEVTDWSTIKSFKIELNDNNIWVKGQDIELTFSMTAPEDLKADYVVNNESSQLPARTEELETKAAWNSFAVTTNTLLPTEPERVGVIVLNDTPPITKKVGDSTNGEYALDKNTQKFFYRINTRLPLDAQSFEVTDSLDKSLMLVENDPLKIVVNVDGSASTIVATSSTENGQTKISVKFDETFIKNNAGKDVEIIINAQVKPDADLSSYVDGKIPNTADYIINDNPETKKTTPPVNVVVKGTVIAQYFIEGTEDKLQDDKSVKIDEVVGEQYSDVPPKTLVKDGKTYVLVETNNTPTLKDSSAPQNGTVVGGIQEIKYQYKLASAPEIGKDVDGSTEKELSNVEEEFTYNINTTFPIGATTYEVSDKLVSELEYVSDSLRVLVDGNEFSEATVSSDGGVVRVTFSKAQIAANEGKEIKISFKANIKAGANLSKYENGKIPNTASYTIDGNPDTKKTTDPVNVSVKKGGEVLVQYVIQGTNDQLSDPSNTNTSADNPGMYIVQPKDTAVGTAYSTTPPATLVKDGKTYELVEIRKNPNDASASGKVTEDKQIVTYEYKLKEEPPAIGGNVQAQYFIKGTDTKLQDDKTVASNEPVGTSYTDVPPARIVKDGKTYILTVDSENIPELKDGSALPKGQVKTETQTIMYQYELVKDPEIGKDVDGTTEKELSNVEEEFTYNINTTFPIGATTYEVSDKLVDELEYVDGSIKVLVDNVEFTNAVVTTDRGIIKVSFTKPQIGLNESKAIKVTFKAKIKAGANISKYADGKIPNTASYIIDGNPETKKTTDPVNVSVKKGGEVLVQYVIQGTNDQLSDPSNTNPSADNPGMYIVQPKDTAVGTEYSTTPPATLVKDGKTYELVEIRKNPTDASASGKVTEAKQIVTYEYKLKEEPPVVTPKGSVIVHYEDESGKVIAPSNKIKDNAPVGEEYDSTTPKNRPNEITTDDGKVYELVKYDPKNGSDMPTGKVIEGTKNITYVYRLKTIPEISKKVDVDKIHLDVQTGKEYTYNITVKIPNDISNHNKFEITDELDSRLTVVGASITGDNSKYFNETKIEGNKVIASISDFAKADEIKGTSVELVITAKINNGVIIDKIPNSAVVVYNKNGLDGNPTEDNTTPPTPPVTVTPNYGGGSVVVKYEDENGNPIKDDNTVNPKGTAPGTPYDTTTINNRPKEIINNGKTYVLVKEDPKAGSDNPKGTVEDGKDKVVTYVYKLKEEVPETEKPSITKKINENIDYLLVENEKSFNYNIKTTIPIDIEKYTKFEISDAIDARLTVVNVTIKGDTQGLFTVTENNGVISAKMSDFAKAKEYAGKVIELVVTAKIKNGITSSIPNVASVTYNNTPGTTTDKKETTTPVTVVPKRPGTPITPNDNPSVPSFEEPKISKVINGSLLDLQIGNEKSFKYNITSYLPNDIANYTKYVITDKVDNNIKVVSAKVVGDASKYFDVVVKDNTVTATMKDFGNANVFAGKNIELEITSEINKGVKTVNIPNTATVSYRRSSGSESEKKSNTVYVTPNNNSNGTSSTNDNNNTTTTTTTNNNNIITKLPKTGDSNLTQIVGLVALSISLLLLSSYRKSKKL